MIISVIAALDEYGGIGRDNRLPWHLPADLRLFKQRTLGHHLILGRKTYASLGHPLPGRTLIIVTHQPDFVAAGCLVVGSLQQALDLAQQRGESEVFIAGGAEIYARALPLADRLYLTRVHAHVEADRFFPEIDWQEWEVSSQQTYPMAAGQIYAFTFMELRRK